MTISYRSLTPSLNVVRIPSFSAPDLLIRTAARLLASVDNQFRDWNFLDGEQGQTFEARVLEVHGSGNANPATVRRRLQQDGFTGNVAAFLAWLQESDEEHARIATLPEDDRLFKEGPSSKGLLMPVYDIETPDAPELALWEPAEFLADMASDQAPTIFLGFRLKT